MDYSTYPKSLKLIQDGRTEDFIDLLNSSQDLESFIYIKHKKSGDNASIVAARFGRLEILTILASYGMDFEKRNNDGKRALHEASYGGHLNCVKFLINLGVEVDCLKRADWTPLLLACTKHDLGVVDALVKAGASITQCNKDGWDCFHLAAREGYVDILEYLLDNLKKSGIWSSERTSKNGRTPLHTAALHGRLQAVDFMVTHCDFKPDIHDSCGSTPLMDAIRGGHIDVADILVKQHKASVNQCDKVGHQPIHLGAQAGSIVSIEYLINHHFVGPQTLTKGSAMTPLHCAAKEGQLHVLDYLFKFQVDVDAQDSKGRTAIHLASAAGYDACVTSLLCDHSANSLLCDINGKTPLDYAIKPSVKNILENSVKM